MSSIFRSVSFLDLTHSFGTSFFISFQYDFGSLEYNTKVLLLLDAIINKLQEFDIEINEKDEKKAKIKAEEMCKKLLANLVIEDFKIL